MTTPPAAPAPQPEAQPAPQSYAAPPSYPAQPVRPPQPTNVAQTNAFALVSVILAFLQPIAGIVFGHIALSQIKRNGDTGRGLALTGVIVGYVWLALGLLFFVFYISFIGIMVASFGSYMDHSYSDLYSY